MEVTLRLTPECSDQLESITRTVFDKAHTEDQCMPIVDFRRCYPQAVGMDGDLTMIPTDFVVLVGDKHQSEIRNLDHLISVIEKQAASLHAKGKKITELENEARSLRVTIQSYAQKCKGM